MRRLSLLMIFLLACAPSIDGDPGSTDGDAGSTSASTEADAGADADGGAKADAGTAPSSGTVRACVLSSDGTIDSANCTRLRDTPPKLPTLDFGPVTPGHPATIGLRIFNDGPGLLHVSSVTSGDPQVTTASEPRDVGFGETTTFHATYSPTSDGPLTTTLTLATSDSVHPTVNLPVTGSATGFTPKSCVDVSALAFGDVAVGRTKTLSAALTNCGQVPLTVRTISIDQDGSAFALDGPPSAPVTLPGGDQMTVAVVFTPPGIQDFAGQLTIETVAATTTLDLSGSGHALDCSNNAPTTVMRILNGTSDVTANPTVPLGASVTYDASGSAAPFGGATYRWRILSQPTNGRQRLSSTTAPATTFVGELPGDYTVRAEVVDQHGCTSGSSDWTVHVVPTTHLLIQLTWAEEYGDLDLHLLGPGGTFDDQLSATNPRNSSDCFWRFCEAQSTPRLDWGLSNSTQADHITTNDPTLDIDEPWGHGPEQISYSSPFPATYTVVATHFCSREAGLGLSYGPSNALVKVFVDGVERLSNSKSLTQRDVWTAATITVGADGAILVAASNTVRKSSGLSEACTRDQN